ncbi:MAG TPA: dihydrofolate reductase, partial [Caulobacteraceae bacterium]|nr:dihydrofolate reductase [Caulobacteraceae bacterium]
MIRLTLGPIARARNGVFGDHGALPWRLKTDLQMFKALTLGKPIIMGRKTWDSLPIKPLPGRTNIVLSRDGSFEPQRALVCETLDEAIQIAREQAEEDGAEEVCVIGGAAVAQAAFPKARRLYLTEVEADPGGDVVLPEFDLSGWAEVRREHHEASEGDQYAFTFRM